MPSAGDAGHGGGSGGGGGDSPVSSSGSDGIANDDQVLDGLYSRFGVQGLPTVAFVDPMGKVMESPRVVGYLPADKFVAEMQKVAMTTCSKE